ncbi:glycosyltransferase family 4 protein [Patescibacteria group bacterium]|jgi:mannosyltransferase|nr:glycosyltransferase family 4 protein [Patescibacteria group bacterium]
MKIIQKRTSLNPPPALIDQLSAYCTDGAFFKPEPETREIRPAIQVGAHGAAGEASPTVYAQGPLPRELVRRVEIITPNFTRHLSGVTATLERILPVLAQHSKIAALGTGLSVATTSIRFRDLPLVWEKPTFGDCRVWHARRNIEMLAGIVLRDALGFPLRLVFTSASQRQHTSWTRWLIRRMDEVIATSNKTAAYLERPASVVGHGIATDAFFPARSREAARAGLDLPNLKLIGCFGRIRRQKGSDVFVDAMLDVLASRRDVCGVLMGRATFKHSALLTAMREKIEAAGLSQRFLILPEVAISEMPQWYRALDIYVAPQRWEGFGVTPLEAMATGLPVIATKVGAFPEILTNDTGLLVNAGNVSEMTAAILTLLDNPERSASMGNAGRLRVFQEFSLEGEAKGINRVYQKLLGRQSSSIATAERPSHTP